MISGKGRVWPSSFTFARNVLAKTNAETGRLANGVELSATRFAPPTPPRTLVSESLKPVTRPAVLIEYFFFFFCFQ